MSTFSVGFQSTLINPANYYIAAVYDFSNLVTPVETYLIAKGGGYPATFQVTFLNSYTANKLYRIILYENTSLAIGGTTRCSADAKASVNATTLRGDARYIYGVTATFTNNTTIVDSSLIGWGISFEQFGSGTLNPGTDYTFDNTTGTVVLINGSTYVNGQNMIVHFQPQVAAVAPSFSGVSAGRIVAVATTLSNSDANSAIYLQGSAGSFIVTLPALSAMTDYQPLEFYSFGGNHIYATLLPQGTDKIQLNGQRVKIFLRQSMHITLFKANGIWNVRGESNVLNTVGEIVYKYSNTDFPYLLADGSSGGLLSRSTYSGLWNYVQGLSSAALISEAAWGNITTLDGVNYYPNKGLWTAGDGSTTFRVPLLINQFLRGADGSARQPGSFQADAIQVHTHDTVMAGTGGVYPYGKTPGTEVTGGDTGAYTKNGKLSSPPYTSPGAGNSGTLLSKIDVETRPENIALYALIRL